MIVNYAKHIPLMKMCSEVPVLITQSNCCRRATGPARSGSTALAPGHDLLLYMKSDETAEYTARAGPNWFGIWTGLQLRRRRDVEPQPSFGEEFRCQNG